VGYAKRDEELKLLRQYLLDEDLRKVLNNAPPWSIDQWMA
jgi:hypothetical protein